MRLRYAMRCARAGNWIGTRYVLRALLRALWPFCRRCGRFGFHGHALCLDCACDALMRELFRQREGI